MKNSLLVSIFLGFILFVGCGSTSQPQVPMVNGKPAWVLNPKMDGKDGAVGIAAMGYDMKPSTQRKLAIQRALDELALEKKVKVELTMTKHEHLENDHNAVVVDSQSTYKSAKPVVISAHIESMWEDKTNGLLYVWLVLDN